MIKLIKKIVKKILGKKPEKKWHPPLSKLNNLISIGTEYGAWTIPSDILTDTSVCYLVGAGEDISFDIGIADKYKSTIHIFDPTPRAISHYEQLISSVSDGKTMSVNSSETNFYSIQKKDLSLIHFHDTGLWSSKDEIKFFAPKNKEHVSHSAVNLQKTSDFFIAKVDRLSNIMKDLGDRRLDLLKIDIEGAEYEVVNSIIEDNIDISILCVEYDEAFNPLDDNWLERVKESVNKIISFGYKVVDYDDFNNYTFLKNEIFEKLNH